MTGTETEYEAAAAELESAEARFYEVKARSELAKTTGLRYATLDVDQTRFAVAQNGRPIGELVPARPGQILLGWRAFAPDGAQLPGEYRCARAAAAAALAARSGTALSFDVPMAAIPHVSGRAPD